MMITRRTFLAGTILASPTLSLLASAIRCLPVGPVKEAEFFITLGTLHTLSVTTFSDGSWLPLYGGAKMETREDRNGWKVIATKGCECKLRRDEPQSILVDWIRMWERRDGNTNDWATDFRECIKNPAAGICAFDDFVLDPWATESAWKFLPV